MAESNSDESTSEDVPVVFVDMQSLAQEEEDECAELTMGNLEPTTVVTQEEIETMLKCTMRALDSNSEVMNILLQLNRMISVNREDSESDKENRS